jgi:hypothetical protein
MIDVRFLCESAISYVPGISCVTVCDDKAPAGLLSGIVIELFEILESFSPSKVPVLVHPQKFPHVPKFERITSAYL